MNTTLRVQFVSLILELSEFVTEGVILSIELSDECESGGIFIHQILVGEEYGIRRGISRESERGDGSSGGSSSGR